VRTEGVEPRGTSCGRLDYSVSAAGELDCFVSNIESDEACDLHFSSRPFEKCDVTLVLPRACVNSLKE
jgi:hypothetical protein